jgi:hypothetical protein
MRILNEYRSLYKVRITYSKTGDKESWTMQAGNEVKIFYGTVDSFAKFLRILGASDTSTLPKSVRTKTFLNLASDVQNKVDTDVWVWSNRWNKVSKMLTVGQS